jgi:hypothetical protein
LVLLKRVSSIPAVRLTTVPEGTPGSSEPKSRATLVASGPAGVTYGDCTTFKAYMSEGILSGTRVFTK